MDTEGLTEESMQFFVRTDQLNTPEYQARVEAVMNDQFSVDDEELAQTLALEGATEDSVPRNTTVFYIRSWAISNDTLRLIIFSVGENQVIFPETDQWLEHAIGDRDRPFHLQYVGRVTGKTPMSRHIHDAAPAGRLLGKLLHTLLLLDFPAFSSATVFEFPRARLTTANSTAGQ